MRKFALLTTIATMLPLAAALAAPLSKTDTMFIKKAAMGGMTEVTEGQTAATTATSPDLKAFAQRMVTEHTANNQELMTLASAKGVTPPASLDAIHQKQVDKLGTQTGAAFDKAYTTDQIVGHEAMAKVMQSEIDHGDDADLKAFATKTLPVVQDHLTAIKAMKKP